MKTIKRILKIISAALTPQKSVINGHYLRKRERYAEWTKQ